VREITDGAGVPVVYDSIVKDTFAGSLDCLAVARHDGELRQLQRRGCPFRTGMLSAKGSLYLTPADAVSLHTQRKGATETADGLFAVIVSEPVETSPSTKAIALAEARQAHEALHSRTTTGQRCWFRSAFVFMLSKKSEYCLRRPHFVEQELDRVDRAHGGEDAAET